MPQNQHRLAKKWLISRLGVHVQKLSATERLCEELPILILIDGLVEESQTSAQDNGMHNKYGQKDEYTKDFMMIFLQVLSKHHFGKNSSPYVCMDG